MSPEKTRGGRTRQRNVDHSVIPDKKAKTLSPQEITSSFIKAAQISGIKTTLQPDSEKPRKRRRRGRR